MAISREQKEAQIAELTDELKSAKMSVLVRYHGVTVPEAQELRAELKSQDGNFRVIKNALFKRAAKAVYDDIDLSDLEGPVAVAFGYDDQVMPAKVVADFGKQHEALQPLGAINDQGQRFDADEVKRLASLPSREQLTGQLVGTIAAPLSGFVNVLQGNLRGLVTALNAVAEQQGNEA